MWDLSIFASVTIDDKWSRYQISRQFLDLGAKPIEKGNRLEISFTGNRETVLQLADICNTIQIHSVQVFKAGC